METVFEVIGMGAKKYGSYEKYILEEASQLQKKGIKLIVIFAFPPLIHSYVKDLNSVGAETYVISQDSKFKFIKEFRRLLKNYKPKVVHTNFSSICFIAQPLSFLYGVKNRIHTEHCYPISDKIRLKNRIVYQVLSLLTTQFLSVSKQSGEALKKLLWFNKKKVKTLYLGINDFDFDRNQVRKELMIEDNTIALINIAYHNPIKGVDVLIEAMNIIVNQRGIDNIILYQIGGGQTGDDTKRLHNLSKKYHLEKNIVWLGIRNDVPRLLCAGDLYVQPSRSEGISLSIMEASLANLPIVASKVGGIPEAAIQNVNALLIEKDNPTPLAEAIIKFSQNPSLRSEFGHNGRKHALASFNLKTQVTKLIDECYLI